MINRKDIILAALKGSDEKKIQKLYDIFNALDDCDADFLFDSLSNEYQKKIIELLEIAIKKLKGMRLIEEGKALLKKEEIVEVDYE